MVSNSYLLRFFILAVFSLISFGPKVVTAQVRCAHIHAKDLYQTHLKTIEKDRTLELQTWQIQKEGNTIVSLIQIPGKVVYKDAQFSVTSDDKRYYVSLSAVDPKTGQREDIGIIQVSGFNTEKTKAKIGWINTMEKFRGNDIASLLLSKFLEANPQIQSLNGVLAGVNLATIGKFVYENLKSHPLFNFESVKKLEEFLRKYTTKSIEYNYIEHIRACCSNVPKEVFQNLAIEAVRQAPAYKYRAKFGFTQIEVLKFDFFSNRDNVQINLSREP